MCMRVRPSSREERERERLRRHPAEVENIKGNKELKARQIMAPFLEHPGNKKAKISLLFFSSLVTPFHQYSFWKH